ncbi:MAG: ATP-binding cassette domain-containing protein [Actinomycetota bacterium]|nr:ATP-binding cassette domain-containing protein [Actinomycetota bacterium]
MITARALSRTFTTKTGPIEAVRSVDLDVASGAIVGLLGPNGAGKTTTLRMLTTLLTPTAGTATVAGADLLREAREVRRRIGYVAQIGAAPAPGTRLGEELVAQARLQGMSKAAAVERLGVLLPKLDLDGFAGRALSELSGGQRRRFDIALGLMHTPKVVFLDEPTTGLDPQSRANLWQHIRSLREDFGVTIVLTTHYLDEADALADRLLVMDHGVIVADDTGENLKATLSGDVITVGLDRDAEAGAEVVRSAVEIRTVTVDGQRLHVTVERGDVAVAPVLRALEAAGHRAGSVTVARPTLDDVFLTLTGRTLREDPS